MAGHIIENEDLRKGDTCGFCGGGRCKTWVVTPGGKAAPKIHSTCILAPKTDSRSTVVGLSLKSAATSSAATPCTNVPLKCIFCTPDRWVWKYCMSYHVQEQHGPDLALRKTYPHAVKFVASYEVCEEEKSKVGGGGGGDVSSRGRRRTPKRRFSELEEA